MTIGTLTIIIRGVIYLLWSLLSVLDIFNNSGEEVNDWTITWALCSLVFFLCYIGYKLTEFLITNWNVIL